MFSNLFVRFAIFCNLYVRFAIFCNLYVRFASFKTAVLTIDANGYHKGSLSVVSTFPIDLCIFQFKEEKRYHTVARQ